MCKISMFYKRRKNGITESMKPSTDAWAFSHDIHVPTSLSVVSTKEKTTKDEIVVEMKTNTKNEEAVLLKAVNGDKKGPNDQVTIVVDEQSQFTLNFYV